MRKVLIGAYACVSNPGSTLPGGGDLMAWNVVTRLANDYEVWVLTSAQNRPAIEAALAEKDHPNLHVEYADPPAWTRILQRANGAYQAYAYLWQWRAWLAARRLHNKVHFDLFHHLTYENDWMASIAGALLPVAYVRGPGGGAHRVPAEFRREFALRPRVWEYVRMGLQWVFKHDPFFALGQRRARALLMANREAMDALPPRWRKKAQLLSVNGVSLESFKQSAEGARDGRRLKLLTAGRLIPLKGFDLAIRAFRLFYEDVKRDRQGMRAELTIVGDGPEEARLRELMEDLAVKEHVRLVKWLPREELFKEMAECDAFVFASLRDGGGLVVVEAMAAGKPVICLDLAGPGLHVTEECGIKVAAENPEQTVRDMAAAFGRLARDADLRAAMGRAARRRAEEVYDWKRVAERIEKVYREALGRSGGFTPPNRDGIEAGEKKQSQVAEQAAVEAVAGVGEGGGR